MSGFAQLLASNRNYRFAWTGQIVSEVGDHFNNIAVLSLAVEETHSGAIIAGLMLSRAIPAVLVGPVAGVLLDRFDRKRIMIASDLVRGFIELPPYGRLAVLYQRTLGDSSIHRHQGRVAHREFADADHRLDDARRGRLLRRYLGGPVRLRARIRI
jgi:hypothetical protein